MKVLVVDDSATMLRIIDHQLAQFGCTAVENATNADEAIEILRSKDVDLILCDWTLPSIQALLATVRGDRKLSSVPLIMMIAQGSSRSVEAARHAGVRNVLIKPFDAATLRSKIAEAIKPRP